MAKKRSQTQYCFGKKAAIFDSRTLRFGAYLTRALPAPPDAVNWGKNVKSWPMYYNNQYADCTCAAAGHMIQNWSAAVGEEKQPSPEQVLNFYKHFTTPGPQNSVHALKVLKYWRSTGLAGHKIKAFAHLELRNVTEVKDALSIFGGCYIGVELPKFVTGSLPEKHAPWVVPPQGRIGQGAPDPNGRHVVLAVAYDSRNLHVVTWGMLKSMSWQFYMTYADEAYAILSEDFLSKNKTPEGFDMAQLTRDLTEIAKAPATRATIPRKRAAKK